MRILIVDSGSTKTDWCLAEVGQALASTTTQGINPIHQTDEQIRQILSEELDADFLRMVDGVGSVCYYGAGALPTVAPRLQRLLAERFFPKESGHIQKSLDGSAAPVDHPITVASDLLGAARALFGREEGIACILGTGSNSGLYDGRLLVKNTPPLGYILGDEGSGAVMGRNFLGTLCKGLFPKSLTEEYHRQTGLSTADIIQRVYREPLPNRFLAQTTRFIHQFLDDKEVGQFVVQHFRAFFQRNLTQYQRPDLPVRAIGSVAFYFHDQLACAAKAEGFMLDKVEKSPIEGLISFHNF